MKPKFNFLLFFLLALTLVNCAKAHQENIQETQNGTKVIFYIEHQIQHPEDYLEIKIQIKAQNPSLEKAIQEAQNTVEKVERAVIKYCQSHNKNKKNCEKIVETNEYSIDPIYQLVRKVPTFVAFSVSHETTAKIQQVSNIGKLADDILKLGVSKIASFEWRPLEEVNSEEQAVEQGIQLINNICQKIGMKLGRIIHVSEVSDYEGEDEEASKQKNEEENEEKEQEEQNDTVIYRFEIICSPDETEQSQQEQ